MALASSQLVRVLHLSAAAEVALNADGVGEASAPRAGASGALHERACDERVAGGNGGKRPSCVQDRAADVQGLLLLELVHLASEVGNLGAGCSELRRGVVWAACHGRRGENRAPRR